MTLTSRKYIDDNDIVARYLADKLSDSERESFEAYYLEHPELLKELNRTAHFKAGLIALQEAGELERTVSAKPSWHRTNRIALAASIILIVFCGSIWLYLQSTPRPLIAASIGDLTHRLQSTLPLAGTYEIQRTRSSSFDLSIKIPTGAAAIELRVKPETRSSSGRYHVSFGVFTGDDKTMPLIEIRNIKSTNEGFIPIYLSTGDLSPAIYNLSIYGDKDTGATVSHSSYLIEVVR